MLILKMSQMKYILHPVPLLFLTCCLFNVMSGAQQINIALNTSEDIVVTAKGKGELNFNEKKYLIEAGKAVDVMLSDYAAAVITIDGQSDREIALTLDAPLHLTLDASNTIPFMPRMAYSNLGASDESQARATATELTSGSNSFTIPIFRNNSPPAAMQAPSDPTPSELSTGRVFLFLYGTLGPVPQNAAAGLYTGEINIHVSYASQ
jgi:hypothetical protein